MPLIDDDDRRLFNRARDASESSLATDIDLATASLYQQIRASAQHGPFIQRVEQEESSRPADLTPPQIIIMPGAFHAEHPHTGADGCRVLALAEKLDWLAHRVRVPSLAPMALNASALIGCLSTQPSRPTVLVSLSKGGADVRAAMQRPDAVDELRDVRAWVNLSGMVTGTPLISWLRARPLRCFGVRLLLRLRRQRFADLEELSGDGGSPLSRSFTAPPHVQMIHVVGFPRERHLSNDWARRGHARLAPLGPNDGGGILLRDVMRWPGSVYPVWGADHYLRPAFDISPLLLRILQEASAPQADVAAPVAVPSPA